MMLGTVMKRHCPKCGKLGLRLKRACCVDRRRGVKGRIKCQACGYQEILK